MFLDKKLKNFSGSDFKEASSFAKEAGFLSGGERKALYNFGKTLDRGRDLSPKQQSWAESLIEELKSLARPPKIEENFTERGNAQHITVRQAWHDNKWNGRICKNPSENDYCIGDYSLLSSRIRHRRNAELEDKCSGCVPNLEDNNGYIPPCYWSINTFGDESFEVRHQHPMGRVEAKDLYEELGPSSVFTWPFKFSFTRDRAQQKQQGNYPKNLEKRIERYFNRVKADETIVFTYCNYDNPVSGDEQLYLITGCGLVRNVVEPEHFEIANYDEVKSWPGNQNFPTINWSAQVQLENDSLVRLPYHEYLEEAEESGDFTFLDRIKVMVEEPQLIRCFKYVSMDVGDDEAIFLLTKIKRSLDLVKEDGFYKQYPVEEALQKVEDLLEHCWHKRGYFPGFGKLAGTIIGRSDSNNELVEFQEEIKLQVPIEEQYKALSEIIEDPAELKEYGLENFEDLIFELNEGITALRLSIDDFLKLALIDLLPSHFKRIVEGDKDGEITIRAVIENPYLLFEQYREEEWEDDAITGEISFGPVDLFKIDIGYFPDRKYLKKLREIQNLTESDNERIRAIVIQHLAGLENQGHCFDRDDAIMEKLSRYPLFYKSEYRLPSELLIRLNEDMKAFLEEKLIIKEDKRHHYFYLNSVYTAEETVANVFHELLEMEDLSHSYQVDFSESVQKLNKRLGENFDEEDYLVERKQLYDNIFSKRLYVLTGVPGSGKSFELLRTIQTLEKAGEDYTLLTPTGKAALRLNLNEEGVAGVNAKTIDKFLTENKDAPPNSVEIKNLVIDEMSMVDLWKFYELINLVNFNSSKFNRLILVGDPNQLPPIGYGKVFVDIIEYLYRNKEYHRNIVTLETNCRVEQDKRVKEITELFAGSSMQNEEVLKALSRGDTMNIEGLSIHYWRSRDELRDKIKSSFISLCQNNGIEEEGNTLGTSLNKILGLRANGTVDNTNYEFQKHLKIDRFQIISPYRAGYYSSLGLNIFVQNEIKSDSTLARSSKFKMGDKVIQTQNKYNRNGLYLSNGSMGIFNGNSKNRAKLYFLENSYPQKSKYFDEDEELELAYAITVHKSQGSGFEHTFIIIPNKKTLLSKEMVYTALTRSKKSLSLFIYGEEDEFEANQTFLSEIIDRSDITTRRTTLMDKTFWGYSLTPEEGVKVKSRAEYIIYKKLQELSDNRLKFGFSYESSLDLEKHDFNIKPDFTITLKDGSTIYWEHLGMLNSKKYVRDWMSRKKLFKKENLFDLVITTDESHGLDDEKIGKIIEELISGKLEGIKNKLSNHHYYLN